MAYDSVITVVEDVEDLVGQFNAILAVADGGLSTLDSNQALGVAAGMEGVRQDARTVLTEFDTTQVEDMVVIPDAGLLIALWKWRTATRKGIIGLVGEARVLGEQAAELVTGLKSKVVVSHQGDTLQRIAARELGDWREWPRLLEANPGLSAGELASGTSIVIPDRRTT